MKSRVFVALDYDSTAAAMALVKQLSPHDCGLKVGKELFAVGGPEFVRELVTAGFDVFLDLKYHDIPNTVAKAVKAAAALGVWMVNVHASGGSKMLQAAHAALAELPAQKRPHLVAVTVLTSMSDEDFAELGMQRSIADQVLHLANISQRAGLDGVVCSAHEVMMLKAKFGQSFMTVTPGIRPAGASIGDQQRVMTPEQAQQQGVDVMVIGRPITQADDPQQALSAILASLTKE